MSFDRRERKELQAVIHAARQSGIISGADCTKFEALIERESGDELTAKPDNAWSSSIPNADGYYWWKHGDWKRVVYVEARSGKIYTTALGVQSLATESIGSQWAGPLVPPTHEA